MKVKSTTTTEKIDRPARVSILRDYHQSTLDALGKPNALYIPKMAYIPSGKDELYMGFFSSELDKGTDIFTEFVDKYLEPEDAERTLYLWKYNPHWSTEYETNEKSGYTFIMIPVSEMYKVEIPSTPIETHKNVFENIPKVNTDETDDAPLTSMTILDLAAILLKKPISHKKFINKLFSKK